MSRSYADRLSLALLNEREATAKALQRFHTGKFTAAEALSMITEARDAVDALVAEAHR